MNSKTISSGQILKLLANRHSKDVFVPECKNGPTQSTGTHLRMDAWAMAQSWSNPTTTGYEIKVSRSDFIRDDKWRGYLDYCSDFYFVCPHGLIKPEELDDGIGLLWASKTGTRLYIKRKAARRIIEIPESIFRYVLMCRANIEREIYFNRQTSIEYWHEWVNNKKEKKELGYVVSQRIGDYVRKIERESKNTRNKIYALENIKQRMIELGFNPELHISEWEVKNKLENIKNGLPVNFYSNLNQIINLLKKLEKELT